MKKLAIALVVLGLATGIGTVMVVAKESMPAKTEKKEEAPVDAAKNDTQADPSTAAAFNPAAFKGTAFEAISADPNLSTFLNALNKSGLAEELKGKGPITIFAPNNEAFTKLPEGFLDSLMAEEKNPVLVGILSYHIVPGKILTTHLTQEETPVASLKERAVSLKKTPEGITFNNGLIVKPDMEVSNGAVHIISSIDLNPQAAIPATPAPAPDTKKAEEAPKPEEAKPAAQEKPAE